MSLLPIYDEIVSQMNGDETIIDKSHCRTITRLSQDHLNVIYLIILHHYIQNSGDKSTLPYGSKTVSKGKGIMFKNINQIPEDLQKIIVKYIDIVSK